MCAGCRSIWSLLYHDASKKAIEVAERFADGQATEEELERAAWGAECPTFGYDFKHHVWREWCTDGRMPSGVQRLVEMGVFSERDLEQDEPEVDPDLKTKLMDAADLACFACRQRPFLSDDFICQYIPGVDWPGDWLLRCVFGKPFLPAVTLDPRWITSTVVSLAEAMYQDRAFDRMPILGDALEEVGCNDEDVLKHCRSENPHVRGCWVVDLMLGKS